jgi:hypothetical protein
MTLISALILLCVLFVIGFVAYWIITKFFPEPIRTPALIVVGIILLGILLVQFFPGAANYRIWR